MKNLILSAVMLTGVVAMAQEQPKQAEKQPTPVTAPAAPVAKAAPAQVTKAQPATEQQTAPVKKETVATEKKVETKKAEPAKKSN